MSHTSHDTTSHDSFTDHSHVGPLATYLSPASMYIQLAHVILQFNHDSSSHHHDHHQGSHHHHNDNGSSHHGHHKKHHPHRSDDEYLPVPVSYGTVSRANRTRARGAALQGDAGTELCESFLLFIIFLLIVGGLIYFFVK